MEITVAICTYNRARLLEGALSSLCRQAVPASCFEIMVVDNGSTDNTVDCVQACQLRFPYTNIRLIFEGEQGLGLARTTAVQNAHGRYIAFIDDDARAEADWLAQALAIFHEQGDELVCLGGPILPYYNILKPVWFKDTYETHTWGNQARQLNTGESFNGSNMIWRKDCLQAIGSFSGKLGVKGDQLSAGEETDAFGKAWRQFKNPFLYYEPALRIMHVVAPFKMRVSYRLKRAFVTGQVAVQLQKPTGWLWRVVAVLGGARVLLLYSVWALRRIRQYEYWQNWLVEEGEPVMKKLGIILASLGILVRVKQS